MLQVSELVSLAQQGDSTAFATLYEGYRPTIYRFLRRRLDRSNQAVEDLTEDVFVKVFERLDRYEERGLPFTAWLYRIARNHVVDCLRAQRRTACQSLEELRGTLERHASREFDRVLDRETLQPALARLTAEQRQAVELRFFEALSVAETAAAMKRSEAAVKKLQARGLAKLRCLLSPLAPERMPAMAVHARWAVA